MRKWLAVGLPAGGLPLLGWGPEGYRLVACIADSQLTPAARDHVAAILAPGETLASLASWADEIRRTRRDTGPWHYIDIPIEQNHVDMARACAKSDCVIAKIEDLRKVLQDPASQPGPLDVRRIDRETAMRILEGLARFLSTEGGDVKVLRDSDLKEYRLRVGDYRTRFHDLGETLQILSVRHRREPYR